MKSRNIVILCLVLIGVVSFVIIQGIVNPQMTKNKEQYTHNQQNPLTHDIQSVLKYKSKYMGDASNIMNLVQTLPLSHIDKSFQLLPDVFTVEINYKEDTSNIEKEHLETSLIYNATAVFSLIDNLGRIHFNFDGDSYEVMRSDVEQWYDVNLSTLTDEDTWHELVQSKLTDDQYVLECMNTIFVQK